MKKIIYWVLLLQLFIGSAFAQQAFVVQNIHVEGLQGLSEATVESYMPIKKGQTLTPSKTSEVVRALYKTGFFDHISLKREGSTLIVNVVERPTIGSLKIKGNSVLPTDKLTTVMNSLDIAEGKIYNPRMLDKIKKGLLNQYYQLGHYNAQVDIVETPMSRNRVAIQINISEGVTAKIRRITIIGNKVFDESTLIKQLDISPSNIFTIFTQSDRFSDEKMEDNIDKLRGYYMDHGYLKAEVRASQAQISPDRKSVYVTFVVDEGEPYTIEKYTVTGETILPREEYAKLINIQPGETFSRQKVIDAQKAINKQLGDQGYMNTNINLRPTINEKNRTVVLDFHVTPGKRAYMRQITFTGNSRTNDSVLRRELSQMEGAPVSTTKLEDSKTNLKRLPYIKDREVDYTVLPVEGSPDQVDANYKVTEDNSAQATFKVGYSQAYNVEVGAGINQKNFLGTGNTLGLNITNNRYQTNYGLSYTDPYYTQEGISRMINLQISKLDPKGAGITTGFTSSEYDASVLYGIPIGQEKHADSRILAGVGYQNTLLHLIGGQVSNQVNDFVDRHGTHYQQLDLKLGLSRDSRNRYMFPTSGSYNTLFLDGYAPLSKSSVSFYTLSYSGRWYQPITDEWIFLTKGNFNYGNGLNGIHNYPPFRNFYSGGMDSVRGYVDFSLGPLDSKGSTIGGNIETDASIALIFPNHLYDSMRTSVFFDAGNVYSSMNNRSFGGASTNSGPIRFSTGIQADILTPLGPVSMSMAKRLNPTALDRQKKNIQVFGLALSGNF